MGELNSGPPNTDKTNPSIDREEDLNPEPPDYKLLKGGIRRNKGIKPHSGFSKTGPPRTEKKNEKK